MIKSKPEGEWGDRGKDQPSLPIFQADPDKTEEAQIANPGEQKRENINHMLTNFYNAVFRNKAAAWTAIFTCVLAVFSYLLWQVSDAANRLAIATQAASVTVSGPGIIKQSNPDGKTLRGWSVSFLWANNGSTATRTAELQSNVYVGTESARKGLDFSQLPQDRIVTAVIGPHAGIQLGPGFVTPQDTEDVNAGKKHMFFWGWIVYHDGISPEARLTEYCFNVESVSYPKADHTDFTQDALFVTNPCGVHFCFNEDCEDYKSRTK